MDSDIKAFVLGQRVGRMASVDAMGYPHVVPICFAFDGNQILYTAIDSKPKVGCWKNLKRVRNIDANPHVSVVLDRYSERWKELAYVILHGTATLLIKGPERDAAELSLREKYEQYKEFLEAGSPVIRIRITRQVRWGSI